MWSLINRRATKHPVKIRAGLRVGAAPASRRVAGSLNRSSAIRLASPEKFGAPNAAIRASDLGALVGFAEDKLHAPNRSGRRMKTD